MSAQPKQQPVPESPSEKQDERHAWEEEQEKHAYYYDDAHGYELFDAEKEEVEQEQTARTKV